VKKKIVEGTAQKETRKVYERSCYILSSVHGLLLLQHREQNKRFLSSSVQRYLSSSIGKKENYMMNEQIEGSFHVASFILASLQQQQQQLVLSGPILLHKSLTPFRTADDTKCLSTHFIYTYTHTNINPQYTFCIYNTYTHKHKPSVHILHTHTHTNKHKPSVHILHTHTHTNKHKPSVHIFHSHTRTHKHKP